MSALICGSLAFDTIMVFPDQFKNHILPEKVHILNVSFLVPAMRREFGGCAGNIAYNLKLLGGDPVPMATVGQDLGPYRAWFEDNGVRLDHVKVIEELFTPQAFIPPDPDNNQITAFHPKQLRGHPVPMATVAQDFGPYRAWLEDNGIRLDHVKVIDEMFTPQAFITTDHHNSRITAFHPGAMMRSHENHVSDVEVVK